MADKTEIILWTPPTDSSPELKGEIERMMAVADLRMDSSTPLTADHICTAIIKSINTIDAAPVPPADAVRATKFLMGAYPARSANDPDVFIALASEVIASYDQDVVRQVIRGLPKTLKFLPTIAEIKEALDTAIRRRFAVKATAMWMIGERERRRREAEEKARWNLSPEELERRRQQVAALIPGFKTGRDA